jgi:hypothetical protein
VGPTESRHPAPAFHVAWPVTEKNERAVWWLVSK